MIDNQRELQFKKITYNLRLSQTYYRERRVTLYREVNSRVRYYSLKLSMTLFGEYLLIKENGSVKNKRPTRVVKEYFETLREAMKSYRAKLLEKTKKGYLLEIKEISQGKLI